MVKCFQGEENDFNRTVSLIGLGTKIHSSAEGGANEAKAGSSHLISAY